MFPVFAIAYFFQIQFYPEAIYFRLLSDCYEAFALASFFALICHYVAPDLHVQKAFFFEMRPKPWIWPLSWLSKCCYRSWKTPSSGLTWFNIIWIGVYQYCFVRVGLTISGIIANGVGKYCEDSNSPAFAKIWPRALQITVLGFISLLVAMFCLLQFYVQLRKPLAEHKLSLKFLAIKGIIFLSFLQNAVLSFVSAKHSDNRSRVLAYADVKVGLPALLLCIELALFAVLNLRAYPSKPYLDEAPISHYPDPDPERLNSQPPRLNMRSPRSGGPLGILAIVDALNPWDFVKAFARGIRWLFCGVKRRNEDTDYSLTGLQAYFIPKRGTAHPNITSPEAVSRAHGRMRAFRVEEAAAPARNTTADGR
ncbi:hypothetical protein CDD83_6861 [Cordyceps sp. RAO-2017]|nr:hypothetical protein CDD83_6861 [Cordyceps sp. RAO-2017]